MKHELWKSHGIIELSDQFYLLKTKYGFDMYENGLTHATRISIIGFTGLQGIRRAKKHLKMRLKK